MEDTKYYEMKSGVLFAKCKKDDQDETIDDGRYQREWEYAGNKGKTLGWKKEGNRIVGLIESAFVKDFFDSEFLNIGFQGPKGVEVIQICVENDKGETTKSAVDVGQILRGIDLSKEVIIEPKAGKPYTTKHGNTVQPWNLQFSQVVNGKESWVPWTFNWEKGAKWYTEGVPKPEMKVKKGKETMDYSGRDEVFYNEIVDFIKRVDSISTEVQGQRERTPAEVSADKEEEEALF